MNESPLLSPDRQSPPALQEFQDADLLAWLLTNKPHPDLLVLRDVVRSWIPVRDEMEQFAVNQIVANLWCRQCAPSPEIQAHFDAVIDRFMDRLAALRQSPSYAEKPSRIN